MTPQGQRGEDGDLLGMHPESSHQDGGGGEIGILFVVSCDGGRN